MVYGLSRLELERLPRAVVGFIVNLNWSNLRVSSRGHSEFD